MTKIMTMMGLDVFIAYDEIGIAAYKWICLIGIILVLTICNRYIRKFELKLIVGK